MTLIRSFDLSSKPFQTRRPIQSDLSTLPDISISVHLKMMIGGTFGQVNPNSQWLNARGVWLTYIFCIALLHFILLSMPFLSVPLVWTLTNLIHNAFMFIFLHLVKGTPWESGNDQGKFRLLTHWEQIDDGIQFTATRKFLTIIPIVLFFLTNFYTKYDTIHFVVNFISLITVLLPKFPQFHGVRIFGINKY